MTIYDVLPTQFKNWTECKQAAEPYIKNGIVAFPIIKDFTISDAMQTVPKFPDPDEPTEIVIYADYLIRMAGREEIEKKNWIEKDYGYSKELPKGFKTWFLLFEYVKKNTSGNPDVIVYQVGNDYKEFLYQDIRNFALEEVMEERIEKGEVFQLEAMVFGNSQWVTEEQKELISRVKRILLLIAKR